MLPLEHAIINRVLNTYLRSTYLGVRWASGENIENYPCSGRLDCHIPEQYARSKLDRAAMNGVKFLETPRRLLYLWIFAYSRLRAIALLQRATHDRNIAFYSSRCVESKKRGVKCTHQLQCCSTLFAPPGRINCKIMDVGHEMP